MSNKQTRAICFTIYHDYSEDYEQQLYDTFEAWPLCTYAVYQFESCPTTNRCHVQGYAEFSGGCRWSTFKSRLSAPSAHLEARRGTAAQASEYCQKEESRILGTSSTEYGTCSGGQGSRSDLAAAACLISSGASLREVAISDPVGYIRHHRGFTALKTVLAVTRRTWKPQVIVYYGAPGTGKTRRVYDKHGYDNVYEVPTPRSGSEVWFDGYIGQQVILVDDFYGWFRWSFLLKFIDRYPQDLPVKGGFTPNLATFIYFTSNTSPENWYNYNEKMVYGAFERRVDEVLEMNVLLE